LDTGVEAVVQDSDLPLVRDMGSRTGDELQGEKRADHVFSDPLGLFIGFGPDAAVDIESGLPPREEAVPPFGAEKLPADKIGQDLAGKE